MIQRIDHVALSVTDLERSVRFYCDLFGMQALPQAQFQGPFFDHIMDLQGVQGKVCTLKLGETYLELFEFQAPEPKKQSFNRAVCDHGITHICFQVTDLDAEYERLKSAGVRFHHPPEQWGRARAVYGRDPDGNVLELFEWVSPPTNP